jgi:hypothetical protein
MNFLKKSVFLRSPEQGGAQTLDFVISSWVLYQLCYSRGPWLNQRDEKWNIFFLKGRGKRTNLIKKVLSILAIVSA